MRATFQAIWLPLIGPQNEGYWCEADELFYGGAAGGSKSQLLLGLSVTAHLHSIIFRREYTQLTGPTGLIEKSREILQGTGARWNGQEHTWRDIPGERSLEFGALQQETDWLKFAGRPHDLICFDELPQFTKPQYRAIIGWNRTEVEGQRCRVVATGNPPTTEEGRWVIDYWGPWLDPNHPHPAHPGELRWYAMIDGEDTEVDSAEPIEHSGETIAPKSRTFLPARVIDNPYYMLTDYVRVLQNLPEPLKSQMLDGDFQAMIEDDPWQVIPTSLVIAAQKRWTPEPPRDEQGEIVPVAQYGVDPARGGRDEATISARRDAWFAPIVAIQGVEVDDGPKLAARVISQMEDDGADLKDTPVNVDITGVGSSPYDSLLANDVYAIALNYAGASDMRDKSGKLKMRNLRAALHWSFREALQEPDCEIALPPDSQLRGDLTAARWKLTASGIQIEDKEEIKKRLGRSPDRGEAVLMAHWMGRSIQIDWF